MSKLILLLSLTLAAGAAHAIGDLDFASEGMAVKVEKCTTGKCFSSVADPNFPDSTMPTFVRCTLDKSCNAQAEGAPDASK